MFFASTLQHVKDGRSLYAVSQQAWAPQILHVIQELLILILPQAREEKFAVILKESILENYSSPSKTVSSWDCPACSLLTIWVFFF